jgi:hypothetical protein
MYIYYDENNYVTGYGSEQEERSFEADFIPEGVDKYLGCYQYINNEYIPDEKRIKWLEQQWASEKELYQLEEWFKWYDEQCIQYSRARRLGIDFDKDIEELDAQAVINAARIKELRAFMATPYSE